MQHSLVYKLYYMVPFVKFNRQDKTHLERLELIFDFF